MTVTWQSAVSSCTVLIGHCRTKYSRPLQNVVAQIHYHELFTKQEASIKLVVFESLYSLAVNIGAWSEFPLKYHEHVRLQLGAHSRHYTVPVGLVLVSRWRLRGQGKVAGVRVGRFYPATPPFSPAARFETYKLSTFWISEFYFRPRRNTDTESPEARITNERSKFLQWPRSSVPSDQGIKIEWKLATCVCIEL